MSAHTENRFICLPMQFTDLPAMFSIEMAAHEHPWTFGQMRDSWENQHPAWVVCDTQKMHTILGSEIDRQSAVKGYLIVMRMVDEIHILNMSVVPQYQGKGLSSLLWQTLLQYGKTQGINHFMLEVRVSNLQAQRVYRHFGFTEIARRKNYYPAANQQREDALIMRKST